MKWLLLLALLSGCKRGWYVYCTGDGTPDGGRDCYAKQQTYLEVVLDNTVPSP
jgi:hypothetical protein